MTSLVQSTNKSAGGASTTTLAYTSSITASSLKFGAVGNTGLAVTATSSMSDNVDGSWAQDETNGGAGNSVLSMNHKEGATAGATTVTGSTSVGGGTLRLLIEEWNGIVISSAFDQGNNTASGSPSTSVVSGNTGTLAQSNSLAIGTCMATTSVTISAGTNYTLDLSDSHLATEWQLLSSTAALQATFTLGTASQYQCQIGIYKEGTGGGGNNIIAWVT